ncbi:hypothetical protein BU25DRAFT_112278 [Macroventuria anomochaeta]|uniref:Uncharacterized protein n=1 Tax=Macroventuria anomochaeta TaxID=301207 RepID=A0ACB6RVZ9_9PLEO|nr:uncharacterized protein BU25DRAFT_112278 [Macroventuria anomochaeta]KAF2625437.1 hypothetical protein BU25DRAFT_112278 [Macroventuria anomochaeta]
MPSCCRTCDHRNHAVYNSDSIPSLVNLCLVALTFKEDILPHTKSYTALNTLLNDIIDAAESSSHPSTFTSWSLCLSDPRTAVVVTTASETCSHVTSPIYNDIFAYLASPPSIQQLYLDYSILSLATSSPEQRIPCEIMVLRAPTSGIAAAIGKHFGWEPRRSSLSSQMQNTAPAAFSRPGDLIRDFWAWAELPHDSSISRSSSLGSSSTHLPPPLVSTNSDEKNMSLYFAEEDEEDINGADDEALVMIFQWHDHVAADRFKHPLQKSFGRNGDAVRNDLWDEHVARPVRHFQSHGAKLETYRLDLRAVEPRMQTIMRAGSKAAGRERSGSKRLSMMALGLGEKVSGMWR